MRLEGLRRFRYLVCFSLVIFSQVGCADGAAESDCRRIQQDVTTFVQQSILPLVDSKSLPRVDMSVVVQLKALREQVRSCALPDMVDDESGWDEDSFVRLDGQLAFFEVTLEQAAEEGSPEITSMLFDSQPFQEAVQRLINLVQ